MKDLAELDHPKKVVAAFKKAYPASETVTLHPVDVEKFIFHLCATGKPVNFVPVVNEDVRRWFKSDSLWQAQNSHYTADQVLVIPGPEAVKGIAMADEPIADLLGRYEQVLVKQLESQGEESTGIDGVWNLGEGQPRASRHHCGCRERGQTLTLTGTPDAQQWFETWGTLDDRTSCGPDVRQPGVPRGTVRCQPGLGSVPATIWSHVAASGTG